MVEWAVRTVGRLPGIRRTRVRVWLALFGALVSLLVVASVLSSVSVEMSWVNVHVARVVLGLMLAALLCEFMDSSLGMGYGTTLTPLLLIFGYEPLVLVPCVLLSEFVTGLAATLMHQRDGNVDFFGDRRARWVAALLSVLSTLGAVSAVYVAVRVSKAWLTGAIAIMVIAIGITILLTRRRTLKFRPAHLIALGTVAAFNKGLSGGGYGPLVTAGQVVSGVSAKQAVAITSLAESFTCLVGLIAYVSYRGWPNWTLATPLTVGAILSVPMATLTVRRIPQNALRMIVGVAACLLGILAVCKVASF